MGLFFVCKNRCPGVLTGTKHLALYMLDHGQQCLINEGRNSFKMLDLESKMYLAYGTSLKSEKQAFDRAMEKLNDIDIK
ncbi:MAG: hypothetical protein SWE60_18760, partial [Thermodesulfobacteriota bacterium]|nr:hypothetical protein [Thermodesulfobacteriota bacterium]